MVSHYLPQPERRNSHLQLRRTQVGSPNCPVLIAQGEGCYKCPGNLEQVCKGLGIAVEKHWAPREDQQEIVGLVFETLVYKNHLGTVYFQGSVTESLFNNKYSRYTQCVWIANTSSSKTTINPGELSTTPHQRLLFPGLEQLWLLAESVILTIIK